MLRDLARGNDDSGEPAYVQGGCDAMCCQGYGYCFHVTYGTYLQKSISEFALEGKERKGKERKAMLRCLARYLTINDRGWENSGTLVQTSYVLRAERSIPFFFFFFFFFSPSALDVIAGRLTR